MFSYINYMYELHNIYRKPELNNFLEKNMSNFLQMNSERATYNVATDNSYVNYKYN